MSQAIKGPGMLWVTSRIAKSAQDILDEKTFLKWYDEDHIAEIVETDGIKDAFRYIDVEKGSPSVPKPFLAFYPMPDLAFTQGPGFRNIRVKSDILPGSGIVYDLGDIDVSYMGLVGQTDAKSKTEPASHLLVSAIEPATNASDDQVNRFFEDQISTVSKAPNYVRSLRFKLLYARTNAQSRALKGLPTTDEPAPEPPTWQAVHEFSAEPAQAIREKVKNDSSEVLTKAKQNELHVYKLAKVHGGGKFFE
ncbi:hypothetical protein K491DRAFT_696915 [Lophiostoma macrostomum CBS 122681]|uniref:Uncharacterized protein n=1 Tax=Lophiostoma macrostomum CBS 122681 TaxID=1314788 RepID=A0A6A6STK8_9PLEO|nr:hypothetical protein K491DRAFT_696915 [Lophiostoma macrostomum CBS 122681]